MEVPIRIPDGSMPKDLMMKKMEKEWNATHPEQVKKMEKQAKDDAGDGDDTYESHLPPFAKPYTPQPS